jgi:tetratricopeptide (TPR) repeat protein
LQLENFDDCEAALTEANRIDDEDPEVWAYLCLLSMSLHRYDEFTQCYRQTVKVNKIQDSFTAITILLIIHFPVIYFILLEQS